MPTAWDAGFAYDPEISAAMAAGPVKNGELARGPWPIAADILHAAALAGLPPLQGVSCLLDTTEREARFVRPPFATTVRFLILAAGSGDITIEGAAGGTGTATLTVESDTGVESAGLYQSEDAIALSASDTCTALDVDVSRSGSGVQCYAIAPLWGGWSL